MTTDKGQVQGNTLERSRQFLNIPYAAPPVGDLRWKPPADPLAWTGTRLASARGGRCAQYDLLGKPDINSVEDCLQLNVWTPLAATTKAPVMVFVHGGAFTSGSATDSMYDGANLAAAGNVIVVSLNYRLGPFGFLAHPALTSGATSPNLGLLDQRAALAWVQRNVAAFGGDPANVTIFGESAGAFSVCTQLAMPKSAGLFQRAVMESGGCSGPTFFPLADATTQANALATALGCTDAATAASCLRAKSEQEILNALPVRTETIGPGYLWGPVVGDTELPELPVDAMRGGRATRVPLILGTNANEGQLFTALYLGGVTPADTRAMAQWMFGNANADTIFAQYPLSSYGSPKEQIAEIVTDGIFACPTRRAARAFADSGGTAYLYEFAYPFQISVAPGARAAHGFELPFIFGNGLVGTQLTDTEQPLADNMIAYWTRFARTGNPNGAGAPAWPAYDTAGDKNVVLDLPIGTLAGYKKARCDFWDTVH